MNFYNLATLNTNLKTKSRYHITFTGNLVRVFFVGGGAFSTIFTIFHYNLQLCNCPTV